MNCDPIRDNLSAYIDGELTAQDAAGVEKHVAACDACRCELDSLRRIATLAQSLPREMGPADFADDVAHAIRCGGTSGAARWFRILWAPALAAGVAFVLMVAFPEERGAGEVATGGDVERAETSYTVAKLDDSQRDEEPAPKLAMRAAESASADVVVDAAVDRKALPNAGRGLAAQKTAPGDTFAERSADSLTRGSVEGGAVTAPVVPTSEPGVAVPNLKSPPSMLDENRTAARIAAAPVADMEADLGSKRMLVLRTNAPDEAARRVVALAGRYRAMGHALRDDKVAEKPRAKALTYERAPAAARVAASDVARERRSVGQTVTVSIARARLEDFMVALRDIESSLDADKGGADDTDTATAEAKGAPSKEKKRQDTEAETTATVVLTIRILPRVSVDAAPAASMEAPAE